MLGALAVYSAVVVISVGGQPPSVDRDINVADVVVPGPDWEWGDQNGGPDGQGIVVEIVQWKGEVDPQRYGVRVVWMSGDSNLYRWGVGEKYDLSVIGKVSKETATEMRDRYYEKLHTDLLYQDIPISDFERGVLIDFYQQSNGPVSWSQKRGWANPHSSDPCVDHDWDGVVCENGRVIALDLANNGLAGRFATLPIKQLHGLRSLNLASNQLSGPVPPDLSYLEDLQFLALDSNKLTSYLPDSLARLTKLEWVSFE